MQRLRKNLGSYLGELIDIRAVLADVHAAAREHGWIAETFHRAEGLEWLGLRRPPLAPLRSQNATRIYVSAGIHGDEPATPLAALRLLKEDRWPDDVEIFLVPCLNPIGYLTNRRENPQGLDLNRDYLHLQSAEIRAHTDWLTKQPRFDLCLCLHEDWESNGFYLYEQNPDDRPSVAESIIECVEKVCPVDYSDIIEGREAHKGIIRPNLDPRLRTQWPESFWLITHKTRLSYTLEAPSDFPLLTRVDSLVTAVNAAMGCCAADQTR